MKNDELQTIERLTGVPPSQIKLADDGFWSRGYIIDDGRIVFKFKKSPEVSYRTEIKVLEFINSLGLDINTQKVGWVSPDDSYLGIYGVVGRSLEQAPYDAKSVGKQLGNCLKILHAAKPNQAEQLPLAVETRMWRERFNSEYTRELLLHTFSEDENHILDSVFHNTIVRLARLGEKPVFSHGDLGDGNIFVDNNGKVGVIDFSEMCYLDEAADFMDVSNEELRIAMLDAYDADDTLREKVRLRVLVRPLFVLGGYIKRGDTLRVENLLASIKRIL